VAAGGKLSRLPFGRIQASAQDAVRAGQCQVQGQSVTAAGSLASGDLVGGLEVEMI
jgi:hypothetical protein